jgi:hypothetical protein
VYQGQVVDTETVMVNGNGTYTTPGYTLPTTGTVVGTYQWNASYSGDANNSAVSENGNAAEQVSVGQASPVMKVALLGTTSGLEIRTQSTTTATAELAGGYNPTGTLTFTFRLSSDPTMIYCTQTVTVNGNGTYSTPTGCRVPDTPNVGVLWAMTYGGDSNNNSLTAYTLSYETEL